MSQPLYETRKGRWGTPVLVCAICGKRFASRHGTATHAMLHRDRGEAVIELKDDRIEYVRVSKGAR